ncbi:MAG: hypothetical protein Tsb009_18050 [Planctomycetaceae bacterium]
MPVRYQSAKLVDESFSSEASFDTVLLTFFVKIADKMYAWPFSRNGLRSDRMMPGWMKFF